MKLGTGGRILLPPLPLIPREEGPGLWFHSGTWGETTTVSKQSPVSLHLVLVRC